MLLCLPYPPTDITLTHCWCSGSLTGTKSGILVSRVDGGEVTVRGPALCLSWFQKLLMARCLYTPRCTPTMAPWLCLASHTLRRPQLLSCRKQTTLLGVPSWRAQGLCTPPSPCSSPTPGPSHHSPCTGASCGVSG